MTTSRIALVTGANQGLGRALVEGLAARLAPHDHVLLTGRAPSRVKAAVAETSNIATTRVLRAFAPRLREGGRLFIVASALGTLDKLDDRVADRFEKAAENLEAVDAL